MLVRNRSPRLRLSVMFLMASLCLTGCGTDGNSQAGADVANAESGQQQGQQKQSGGKVSYPEVKTMVLDILHSKEGMSTLKDTMSSPEFKRSIAITDNDIQTAVEKTLQQGQNKSFLSEQMKDPKFAAAIVKSSRTQMMEVQRQLMKDPAYQKDLLTLMKSPEFQQSQFELLQSPEYRKELMKIMTEALQEPTFRLLFTDSMKEAVKAAGGGQKSKIGKQGGEQKKDKENSGESGAGDENDSSSSSGNDSGG